MKKIILSVVLVLASAQALAVCYPSMGKKKSVKCCPPSELCFETFDYLEVGE